MENNSKKEASILVLASGSPRRRELLESAGVRFVIDPADIEENPEAGESADDFVSRAAREKAIAVSVRRDPVEVILGADTIVVVDGEILGKPADVNDAAKMLKLLSGRGHQVITAYCLARNGAEIVSRRVSTEVKFAEVAEEPIGRYIATGEPADKAGAYAIQGRGAALIESISGSYTNVVGLPLCEAVADLAQLGLAELYAEKMV